MEVENEVDDDDLTFKSQVALTVIAPARKTWTLGCGGTHTAVSIERGEERVGEAHIGYQHKLHRRVRAHARVHGTHAFHGRDAAYTAIET